MFNRALFAGRLTRYTRQLTQVSRRSFGGKAHDDHHHHGPAIDTSYTPVNDKFNLPPIPKDGVYRRPRVDGNAYGPWQTDADAFIKDPTDMVPWFDRNGPTSISPYKAVAQFLLFGGGIFATHAFCNFVFGDDAAPDFTGRRHPGPIPELMSAPHSPARQLVVEMI